VVLKQSTPDWNVTDMGGVKQTIDNNYLNILIILIDVSGLKRLKHLKRMGGGFFHRDGMLKLYGSFMGEKSCSSISRYSCQSTFKSY
jgi:hypothetical protein